MTNMGEVHGALFHVKQLVDAGHNISDSVKHISDWYKTISTADLRFALAHTAPNSVFNKLNNSGKQLARDIDAQAYNNESLRSLVGLRSSKSLKLDQAVIQIAESYNLELKDFLKIIAEGTKYQKRLFSRAKKGIRFSTIREPKRPTTLKHYKSYDK